MRMDMHRDTPLILAIEPDQRQAARLKRLVSRRFDAELVVADTTREALAALGTRIPELVLIPSLLSPQDEATLISTFRANAAAARVEILTMPVLTSPEPQTPQRRFLPRRKKNEDAGSPADDAHASAFADQIASCLERNKEEREMREGPSRPETDGRALFEVTSPAAAAGSDSSDSHDRAGSASYDEDVAEAGLAATAAAVASPAREASHALDPDQYGFAALLYRLRASTRIAQELG